VQEVGASLHDYTGAFGDSCIFEFTEALSFTTRKRQNAACEPARVFLQIRGKSRYFKANLQAYKIARRNWQAYMHQLGRIRKVMNMHTSEYL